ncbi:MAG: hypothetical protein K0Q53_614 [Massilibacillus sp.]|jgi:hypothetical protein|nr:hypothetical protein [Massilibacillus sp.]
MYRTYRTTKDTIIAEEVENDDIALRLLTDLDSKEYVMIKWKDAVNIYNFSLVGQVIEIADEIPFEEFRNINYEKLKKESLEEKLKAKKRDYPIFDWKYFAEKGTTSS